MLKKIIRLFKTKLISVDTNVFDHEFVPVLSISILSDKNFINANIEFCTSICSSIIVFLSFVYEKSIIVF